MEIKKGGRSMLRRIFRLGLTMVAIAAIGFGIWYYFTTYQTEKTVHGTLVYEPTIKPQYMAEKLSTMNEDEMVQDCFLQKNGECTV